MNKKKLLTFLMILTIIFATLPAGSIAANSSNNGNGGLNYRNKITPADIKKAGETFAQTYASASLEATLVPDPVTQELIPDYFNSPNWAYSPPLTKFVDELPGLKSQNANALGQYIPVAVPDTTTYPGSDYYEIAVVEYQEKMHSELPPTTLRGYVQLSTSVVPGMQVQLTYLDKTPIYKADGTPAVAVDKPHYLGPAILSESNRPVRIKFYNLLPTGVDGDLFIPVDTTVMGAGTGTMMMNGMPMDSTYTQNRAVIHLHGNNTVWISDGTPHQWITPANDKDKDGNPIMYPQGVSVVDVPNMDTASVSSKTDGVTTLYYTNAQSARLMFYHDHSYGITRLNVYAGEAAPYLIMDDVEKDLINGTNKTGVNPLLQKLLPDAGIPLVIQDKTFVDANTVLQTDPTWHWGTSPYTAGTPYAPTTGDLWYPHVYMPAQNPWAANGVNPFGRWMYGPWFYPPTTDLIQGPVANPYYDPVNAPWEPPLIPGTPTVSMPGESFMDTPLVNGTAYPYMEVDPHAYRFRILNASNDRFFNLQMYVADDTQNLTNGYPTEVSMVPVDPTVASIPSHLEQIMPDQSLKGPDWIQIGTEGGFLPAPVVIPAQPISWNLNLTTFNAGNVGDHSLLLGSAERADVIVDFSQYAGKTLILYNDAPAPFPANDSRYDYYTNNPDQTGIGGAPSTLPGKGPNTRTIMQIRVSANGQAAPYDITALEAVFKKGAIPATETTAANTGVFATDQKPIIIPQVAYDSAYNTTLPSDPAKTFIQIDEFEKTFQPIDASGNLQAEVTLPLEPKAMHDEMGGVYDPYGRMSGMLGLTSPNSTSVNAPFIPYGYASPPVDIIKGTEDLQSTQIGSMADGTQIWTITHNGVDTHTIHTHLFDAQLVNRVAWDGIMIPPDDNELGWKETYRVNPLEITIIAMRPKIPTAAEVPFEVPNSVRLIDPTMPEGAVLMAPPLGWFDPQGNPITQILNHKVNFGWEYVWHCHILSHEEMDMMHALSFAIAPKAPSNLAATQSGNGNKKANVLTWTDNSQNETSFAVQRSATSTGPWATLATLPANAQTYTDRIGNTNAAYYYKVVASNTVGDTTLANFPVVTQNSESNVAVVGSQTAQRPAPPTNLTAQLQTGPQVLLNWTDNAVNETGFVIQRSTNGGAFGNLITVGPRNATGGVSYIDTTVTAGNSYRYQVAAANAAGTSAYSNIATATLPSPPSAPSNVLATASIQGGRNARVTLTWKDNATNETGYVIDRATDPAFTANLVTTQVGANTTTYQTENITRNTPYYFRVRAVGAAGQSASVNANPFPIYTP